MKKFAAFAPFVLLALALTGPAVVRAYPTPPQTQAQKQAQKEYKKYAKQQAKLQKKQLKQQKKQMKQWRKQHGNTTTTVT